MRLKEEQLVAVEQFVSGKDVLSLPTGFGKSLIYGILSAVASYTIDKTRQQTDCRARGAPLCRGVQAS